MLSTKTELYTAPSIQAEITRWLNNGTLSVLTVENKGTSNSVALVVQESDDGNTWSDVQGTNKSISPATSDTLILISTKSRFRLAAQGNEPVLVTVARTINGTVTDLGPA